MNEKLYPFVEGLKVMWLYWPRNAKYRSWQRVDAIVIGCTDSRVIITCTDKEGRDLIRYVSPDRLIMDGQPGFSRGVYEFPHGDGYYPVSRKEIGE